MTRYASKWLPLASACLLLAACQNPQAPAGASVPAPVAPVEDSSGAGTQAEASPGPELTAAPAQPAAPVAPPAPPSPPAPAPSAAPAPQAPPSAPKPPAATGPQYAQVVSVTPVRQSIDNPQQVCRDVEVVRQVAPRDEHRIAGTAIGAVVGGAIGNQIGDGHGRDAARIAGAVGGAIAGRKIQEARQEKKTETRVERQCETVADPQTRVVAYDIVYSYGGETRSARVAEDPGEKIRLPVRSIEP
jgi:uncharacterized protein YcfJ